MGDLVHSLKTTLSSYKFDDSNQYSFLVVYEPLTPLIYRRDGQDAESIMIQSFDESSARIPHMSGDRSAISSPTDFLQYFTFIEFYLNQIVKLLLIDTFSIGQWIKLETVVGSEALTVRSKMSIVKRLDHTLWNKIKPNLSELQELRNSLSHSPVGPYKYKGKELEWSDIDTDMATLTTNLLTVYKEGQEPVLEFVKKHNVALDNEGIEQ